MGLFFDVVASLLPYHRHGSPIKREKFVHCGLSKAEVIVKGRCCRTRLSTAQSLVPLSFIKPNEARPTEVPPKSLFKMPSSDACSDKLKCPCTV